jgi:hypothetical protein
LPIFLIVIHWSWPYGGMVDTEDLKSSAGNGVPVRVRLGPPKFKRSKKELLWQGMESVTGQIKCILSGSGNEPMVKLRLTLPSG